MQKELSADDSMKIRVICPTCEKSEFLMIPKENIVSSGKGLTTILIPGDSVCSHSFQIFVDKNGMVRGYETADFELKFTPEEEKKEQYLGEKRAFEVLRGLLGEEILNKCLRTALNNQKIVCVTEQLDIKQNLKAFFERVFEKNCPPIMVINMEDYNKETRMQVYSTGNKNTFVFNPEMSAIIKQSFKGPYKSDKFELERSITANINVEKQSDDQIVSTLQGIIKDLLDAANLIKLEIENKKITNKKELDKRLQKISIKNIKINEQILKDIILDRYGFDVDKVFLKVEEKLDKLKSLF
jgi:hypothetical protein